MHTMTLVAVDVPPTNETPKSPTPETVQTMLQYLLLKNEILSGDEKHIMDDFYLSRIVSRMTAFSRETEDKTYEVLDPYFTETKNTKYLEFVDCTDEVKEEYLNGSMDCFKGTNGVIYSHYSRIGRSFTIIDGVVYQNCAGPLKHPKRTKKAKRMTALPNYPFKKLYKSWQEYAVQECSYLYIEETDRCGYFCNPRAFYDGCIVGGRYPFEFLVKDSCNEYSRGHFPLGVADEKDAPEGYIWVAAARKKDICWDLMYNWRLRQVINAYHRYQNAFTTGIIPQGMYASVEKKGLVSFGDVLYYKGERLTHFLRRHGWLRKSKYHMRAGAVLLTDGTYKDSYDYNYSKPPKMGEWYHMIDDFIDSLDENAVLVSVDCHM